SKISRIETGQMTPKTEEVTKLVDLYHPSQEVANRLVEQVRRLNTQVHTRRSMRGLNAEGHQERAQELERESLNISIFHPGLIPGLLQTAEYAQQMLLTSSLNAVDVANAVNVRLARQAILFDPQRNFRFLIGEQTLYPQVVDPDVLVRQIDRILNVMTLPNVKFGIIPLTARLKEPMMNGLVMYDDKMVLIETFSAQITIEDQQDLSSYEELLNDLESVALLGDQAANLLQQWSHRLCKGENVGDDS
ncbi:MAG: DUF5753 domain-containing protein, partial [Candidatus Dormibacteraceae bacterium]